MSVSVLIGGGLAANDGSRQMRRRLDDGDDQSGGGSPELRQRRRIDAPGAPEDSPCPRASRGTNGRCGGGRSSPEARLWRRPEFGADGNDDTVHGRSYG